MSKIFPLFSVTGIYWVKKASVFIGHSKTEGVVFQTSSKSTIFSFREGIRDGIPKQDAMQENPTPLKHPHIHIFRSYMIMIDNGNPSYLFTVC